MQAVLFQCIVIRIAWYGSNFLGWFYRAIMGIIRLYHRLDSIAHTIVMVLNGGLLFLVFDKLVAQQSLRIAYFFVVNHRERVALDGGDHLEVTVSTLLGLFFWDLLVGDVLIAGLRCAMLVLWSRFIIEKLMEDVLRRDLVSKPFVRLRRGMEEIFAWIWGKLALRCLVWLSLRWYTLFLLLRMTFFLFWLCLIFYLTWKQIFWLDQYGILLYPILWACLFNGQTYAQIVAVIRQCVQWSKIFFVDDRR